MSRRFLLRYGWLSLATALVTMGLKLSAWWLTGSVGLLSDALESSVNLSGAVMALLMLRLAAMPPDEGHPYGHSKAEYFSSGFEGMLIFLAGGLILIPATIRLMAPQPIEQPVAGLVISAVAAALNYWTAKVLLRAGDRHNSAALQADAAHLATDVWTSIGVIAGVALVALSGWHIVDPLIAIAVALHILWTGWKLVRNALSDLMDAAWPEAEQRILNEVLDGFRCADIDFHAIRTRSAAARHFVSFHVLVPGHWTVQQGHDLLERIEGELMSRLPHLTAFTHLEPIEDPASYQDTSLDRAPP